MSAPKRFPDRDEIAAARAEADRLGAGEEAGSRRWRLAGRVLGRRGHGKLTFLDLVDRSGRLQLLCAEDRCGAVDVSLGDVVGAVGYPARTRRGEPSLAVEELEVLARTRQPLPDHYHGLVDTETRYRKRYLDLMINEETRRDFVTRSRMVAAIRRYLDEQGFVEVETPVLQPRYGGAFARPFVTHHNELDADLYLRIATELYLKRLIVGGLERVYEIGKDFRNESVSYKHQPEFTMLEWYEAYADYRDTMARIEELVESVALEVLGTTKVTFRGHEVDVKRPWRRVRLADALAEHGAGTRDEAELRRLLEERGVDTAADRTWAHLVDHALSHFVEPTLVEPTILYDYPIELSPWARTTDDDPRTVERFEYFVCGMELGNAYTEINDAEEQAARFAGSEDERAAGDTLAPEGDPDYVEALSYGMPPTGGLGLGIDRLAMLFTGRETIRDVVLFPALRQTSDVQGVLLAFPSVWRWQNEPVLLDLGWWRTQVEPHVEHLLTDWAKTSPEDDLTEILREGEGLASLQALQWHGINQRLVPREIAQRLESLGSQGALVSLVRSLRQDGVTPDHVSLTRRGREVLTGLAVLVGIRSGSSRAASQIRDELDELTAPDQHPASP